MGNNQQAIEEVRARLQRRRTELQDRQERVARHTRHREEPLSQDFAEQAIELENGETLVALDHEIQQELGRLDRALRRLDAGQYFDCERCGNPINENRLAALPDTSLCIECAEQA